MNYSSMRRQIGMMDRTEGSNWSIDLFSILFNHCVQGSHETRVDIERTESESWQSQRHRNNFTQKYAKSTPLEAFSTFAESLLLDSFSTKGTSTSPLAEWGTLIGCKRVSRHRVKRLTRDSLLLHSSLLPLDMSRMTDELSDVYAVPPANQGSPLARTRFCQTRKRKI